MPNDRDEIAVTSRPHPDNAEAVLGVLICDALDQPGKYLSVGWLWLALHDAHRTGLVAKTLARGSEVVLVRAALICNLQDLVLRHALARSCRCRSA
jgi:hypothetical protein